MAERKDETQKNEPNPEYRNFKQALKQVLLVSKEELDRRLAEKKQEKKEKRAG